MTLPVPEEEIPWSERQVRKQREEEPLEGYDPYGEIEAEETYPVPEEVGFEKKREKAELDLAKRTVRRKAKEAKIKTPLEQWQEQQKQKKLDKLEREAKSEERLQRQREGRAKETPRSYLARLAAPSVSKIKKGPVAPIARAGPPTYEEELTDSLGESGLENFLGGGTEVSPEEGLIGSGMFSDPFEGDGGLLGGLMGLGEGTEGIEAEELDPRVSFPGGIVATHSLRKNGRQGLRILWGNESIDFWPDKGEEEFGIP